MRRVNEGKIKISEYRVSANITTATRFAFVSDTHNQNTKAVLTCLDKISPDAVLLGGDIIHDPKRYKNGIALLKAIGEKYPAFLSFGNRESRFKKELLVEILKTNITVLDNSFCRFKGISIGGLSSSGEKSRVSVIAKNIRTPDTRWLNGFTREAGFKLLLCHHPEYYDKFLSKYNIDLTISGHAHGGQWRIFGKGVFAPGQGVFPKYTSGIYCGKLLVGRGITNPHKVPKINNKPEIIVLNLSAQ